MLRDQPRIVVVGTSCSGKTTLSGKLATALGREHVELDRLHWGPNWTPYDDFTERVVKAIAAETWVVEGNYSKVRDAVWQRATAVVWLNYPFPLVFYRALSRTIERIVEQRPLYADNRESLRKAFFSLDGIPWWVVRTHRRRRRDYTRLLGERRYAHLEVFELCKPAEAETLLAQCS
jgi:adenylate kinase family enzyme